MNTIKDFNGIFSKKQYNSKKQMQYLVLKIIYDKIIT